MALYIVGSIPDVQPPSAPSISASAQSSSTIGVALASPGTDTGTLPTSPASGIAAYTLDRSTSSDFSANLVSVGLAANQFPYTVSGLLPSTTYYFRARATDAAGNTGAYSSTQSAQTQNASGSADAFGITTYQTQSLNGGIDGGLNVSNDSGASFSAGWDGTYATLSWDTAGTAGLRWEPANPNQRQVYIRLRVKAFQGAAAVSKILKMKGPGSSYSNFTFGPQLQSYSGGAPRAIGLAYSDAVGGGDNSTSWLLDGTLSGGGVYSRVPRPTFRVGTQTNLTASETVVEVFWKFNDDGKPNGEIAIWIDGALKTHAVNLYNCGTGLQKIGYIGVGEYSGVSGVIEKFRDFAVSYDRPVGRGINPEDWMSLFYDSGFEPPEFTPGQSVNGTVMNFTPNNPGTIRITTDYAYDGEQSIELPFNNGQSTIQLDCDLGAEYSELMIEFRMRWPTNFVHVDSASSDNNKMIRVTPATHLTGSGVLQTGIDGGYNSPGKMGSSMEVGDHAPDYRYANLAGEWDTLAGGEFTARSGYDGHGEVAGLDFITPEDAGVFVTYRFYFKGATVKSPATGVGRAWMYVEKNGQRYIDEIPDIYVVNENKFRYVRLWGARNTDNEGPPIIAQADRMRVWVKA